MQRLVNGVVRVMEAHLTRAGHWRVSLHSKTNKLTKNLYRLLVHQLSRYFTSKLVNIAPNYNA